MDGCTWTSAQWEKDRCSGITLRVKRRGQLIVRLKAIKSREDTFCYLSSYLHRSFLWYLVIVTSILSSGRRAEAETSGCVETSGCTKNVWSYWERLLILLRHLIVRKPLSCCGEVSGIVVVLLLLLYLSKYGITVPNLISLEYLVDNRCVHPPSVNFSYRQVDHLSGCCRGALLLDHLENS